MVSIPPRLTTGLPNRENVTEQNAITHPRCFAVVRPPWPSQFGFSICSNTPDLSCQYARYCSESCRVQDMINPLIQHLSACIPTEPLDSSLAVTVVQRDYMHNTVRSFVQTYWDRVRPNLHQAPETTPPLKIFFTVSLHPNNFTKAVVYHMEKQTIVIFVPPPLYEVSFGMRGDDNWFSASEIGTYLNIKEGDLCIRLTNGTETRSQRNAFWWCLRCAMSW